MVPRLGEGDSSNVAENIRRRRHSPVRGLSDCRAPGLEP